MILKNNRISKKDFDLIMKKGRIFNSDLFSLKIFKNVENKGFFGYKVSIVVSKKLAKTAVKRNKIRRRVYSVLNKELLKKTKNFDNKNLFLIFFAKNGSEKATFEDQKNDIIKLLKNSKTL